VSNNNIVTIELEKINLKCDTTDNERGRIAFSLKVNNNTSHQITIAEPDSVQNSLQPKCFLISDVNFPDALNLLIKSNPSGETIKGGESDELNVVLDYDKLKYMLMRYSNKKIFFSNITAFLNSENYSIVYIKFKDSTSYFVSKSSNVKCNCN
jgi:hypothetical protein